MQRSDDTGEGSEDSGFGTIGHRIGGRGVGEKATVAGAFATRIKDRDLAVELEDGPVDEGFLKKKSAVVGEVASGKVVGAVEDEVVRPGKFHRIINREADRVLLDYEVRIEFLQPRGSRFHLGGIDLFFAKENLALKVGPLHMIGINQSNFSHARCREIESGGGPEASTTNDQHRSAQKLLLSGFSHLRQESVTKVALLLGWGHGSEAMDTRSGAKTTLGRGGTGPEWEFPLFLELAGRGEVPQGSWDMNNTGIAIAVAFAGLTAAGGFFLGKGSGGAGDDSQILSAKSETASNSPTASSAGRGGSAVEPNLRGYQLSQNPSAGLATLIEELRKSPMAMMDFEALFNIWDMVQYLDGYEMASLMAELDEMGGGQEMMSVRMMLLNRWAAKDGPAAMESVFEGEKGMMQMMGGMGAMMGWMRNDPEQAYAWFQENGDRLNGGAMGMGKEQFEAMYFASKAKTDFAGTMAKLDGMESKTQKAVIQQLAQSAGADEERRTELLDYLKGKEDASLLKDARQTIVQHMSWQDPKAALAFIESENLDSKDENALVVTATTMWSATDPAGAVEFLSADLKGKENAGDEIANSFGAWVKHDEAEAAEWLAAQPDEFKTDAVFRDSGNQLMYSNEYERSAEWFGQILNEDQRRGNYTNLYNQWGAEDPESADAWKAEFARRGPGPFHRRGCCGRDWIFS